MPSVDETGYLAPQSRLQGRYIIRKTIGEGGMGSVYKAIDTQARNRLVAIKEMNLGHYQHSASTVGHKSPISRVEEAYPQKSGGLFMSGSTRLRESEELFRQEAELLSTLSHPNLPHVYAFFHEHGRLYLVMDFISGKTLRQLLVESGTNRLPVKDMLHYAVQLCDALAYLHQQTPPIIFRDLKPGNVMVTATGNVYLIDFGIARAFKQGREQDTQRLGTPGFASPEHYGSGQTGPRSDLYSLGAMLHYCLTGRDPRLNQPTLFHFLPAHEANPQVPLNLSELIQRLVATREDHRPPDAQTVQQELLAIQQQPSHVTADIPSSYDPKLALAAQLSSQIMRSTKLPRLLDTSWTSRIVPLIANIYATLYAWLLLTVLPRPKRLYRNSIRASISATKKIRQGLSATETHLQIRSVWTPHFLLLFALYAIAMIGCSLYMIIALRNPIYLIALYICLFLLLHLGISYTNQRIHHPLAWGIQTTITLLLLLIVIALYALPAVHPIAQAITLNQLLSAGIVVLMIVSLLRPKYSFGWVDHVCLATVAATYAFLLSGVGLQVQQQWLAIFKPLASKAAMPVNSTLIGTLCMVTLLELVRCKRPFTGIDCLPLFVVALIAASLQFFYGLHEIPHLSLFIFHPETSLDLISFNTLLTGIPVITALLWLFLAPHSPYVRRLPLVPLALACVGLQSFLGPTTRFPLLKPALYPLAYALDSVLHLNTLTMYGLILMLGILLYRWRRPFQWFEQCSLCYVIVVCTLLQSVAWNGDDPLTSTITESQLYLLAINKFLAQALILITIAVLIIAISGMFLYLAREFAWIDRRIVRIKLRFHWLDPLVLRLKHLILLTMCITCVFLLLLHWNNISQFKILSFSITLKQLLIALLFMASVVALVRISRPLNGIDRWIIFINALACLLVLWSGQAQYMIMHNGQRIASVKPWLADPHITLPPQTITYGLIVIALIALMWLKRRIPHTHRHMLKIGFGLTLVCALLQWFSPVFLLVDLIMLTLSILVVMQVEQA
jgi:serine/threonine protein kinase